MTDATLSTVRNAARLLKAFLALDEPLGVSDLARRLGLGKSTVHRLLTTLVAEGLLQQDQRTGGYRLGLIMFELGEAVAVHQDLHAAAGPVLAHLR
ncbi:MAG: helix-turn-helix domain-containing protein, partial [Pseudonocardia sp.]|nr:helix-turn-helix domain-containing protein [Pseudonocardia sp.]